MKKSGSGRVVYRIWKLCNMAFESGVVPEDWRSAVNVLLYKGKGERRECSNYRGIGLLNVIGKIYAGILVYIVRKVTKGLIDDEKRSFRAGRRCVDLIFILIRYVRKHKRKNVECMWVS